MKTVRSFTDLSPLSPSQYASGLRLDVTLSPCTFFMESFSGLGERGSVCTFWLMACLTGPRFSSPSSLLTFGSVSIENEGSNRTFCELFTETLTSFSSFLFFQLCYANSSRVHSTSEFIDTLLGASPFLLRPKCWLAFSLSSLSNRWGVSLSKSFWRECSGGLGRRAWRSWITSPPLSLHLYLSHSLFLLFIIGHRSVHTFVPAFFYSFCLPAISNYIDFHCSSFSETTLTFPFL